MIYREIYLARMKEAQGLVKELWRAGRYRLSIDIGTGGIYLWHGTSKGNAQNIIETRRFNADSYFSHARENACFGSAGAADYAFMRDHRGGAVMRIKVDPRDVTFSHSTGEWSNDKELYQGEDGVWAVKNHVVRYGYKNPDMTPLGRTPRYSRRGTYQSKKQLNSIPFVGVVGEDGFIESYNYDQGKKVDFHHSMIMSQRAMEHMDDDEHSLRFVRYGNEPEYSVEGIKVLDPFRSGLKQLRLFADHVIAHGANPNTKIKIGPMRMGGAYEGKVIGTLALFATKRNPGEYGLHQYIIQPDGSALFIVKLRLTLHAKKKINIINYMEWLLKLPGVNVKVTKHGDVSLSLKDPDAYTHTLPMASYDIAIDLDSNRYVLTDEQIDTIIETYDAMNLSHPVTSMDHLDMDLYPAQQKMWRGYMFDIRQIVITSKSMRKLDDFLYKTWPTVQNMQSQRYHRDIKQKRFVEVNFGADLYLDGKTPRYVGLSALRFEPESD